VRIKTETSADLIHYVARSNDTIAAHALDRPEMASPRWQ